MDLDRLVAILTDVHLWLVLGVAFACGAIGAVIHRGAATDSAAPASGSSRAKRWGADVASGGIAAVAVLYITNPTTGTALVGGSLVAGYAAKTVLAGLEARLTASIAQRQATESRRDAEAARLEAADSKRHAEVAARNLESLIDRVAAMPESASTAALGMESVAGVKQLARDMRARLPLS